MLLIMKNGRNKMTKLEELQAAVDAADAAAYTASDAVYESADALGTADADDMDAYVAAMDAYYYDNAILDAYIKEQGLNNIVMITQDNCKFCRKASKLMTKSGLTFTTINLSNTLDPNQDLRLFLRYLGIKTVPAIMINILLIYLLIGFVLLLSKCLCVIVRDNLNDQVWLTEITMIDILAEVCLWPLFITKHWK